MVLRPAAYGPALHLDHRVGRHIAAACPNPKSQTSLSLMFHPFIPKHTILSRGPTRRIVPGLCRGHCLKLYMSAIACGKCVNALNISLSNQRLYLTLFSWYFCLRSHPFGPVHLDRWCSTSTCFQE